jgi:hypothetical protein
MFPRDGTRCTQTPPRCTHGNGPSRGALGGGRGDGLQGTALARPQRLSDAQPCVRTQVLLTLPPSPHAPPSFTSHTSESRLPPPSLPPHSILPPSLWTRETGRSLSVAARTLLAQPPPDSALSIPSAPLLLHNANYSACPANAIMTSSPHAAPPQRHRARRPGDGPEQRRPHLLRRGWQPGSSVDILHHRPADVFPWAGQ